MKLSPSLITSWIIAAVLTLTVFNFAKWQDRTVMRSDMFEYYAYLPATIIYQDWDFDFIYSTPGDSGREIPLFRAPNGGLVLKMTMGVAILQAPFFVLGHLTALANQSNANGYSWEYHFFIAMSFLFYGIISIFLQRKLLLKYFTEGAVSLTLIAVFLGTNVFFYISSEGAMSHVYSFFLFTVFVSQSLKWMKNYNWKNAIFTGLSFGLIVLIRPVNGVILFIPLLFGVRFFAEFMVRLKDVFSHPKQVILVLLSMALVVFPQLLYWHYTTGEWVYYSYTDQGFFFNDPRIMDGFFGFRKGWLVYTPMAVFSIFGFIAIWFSKEARKFKLAIPIYLAIHIYITYSWWCWWYGGGFSSRPMVESMAILSIPMAALFTVLLSKKYLAIFITLLVALLIGLNQFQTYQYREGILHYDGMNKATYKLIWGKTIYPPGYVESLSHPDYDAAIRGERNEK